MHKSKGIKSMLLIASLAMCVMLTSTASMAEDTKVSIIGGGWAQQHAPDADVAYQRDMQSVGVMINDKYMVSTYTNRYGDKAYSAKYNFNLYDGNQGDITYGLDVAIGVKGKYADSSQYGKFKLTSEVAVDVFLGGEVAYELLKDYSVGLRAGVVPYNDGWETQHFITLSAKL